ncbi:hypothetical protein MUK42_05728 [Musa troglodytarum]|uniref:Uncharacterized protein n=1 Tax=Musa troglodytarum TaxID=320322 RepID=A0A9E7KK23_9LILI|nr:hypothetical protein MUK42_05728 [Musa troglodytarum]
MPVLMHINTTARSTDIADVNLSESAITRKCGCHSRVECLSPTRLRRTSGRMMKTAVKSSATARAFHHRSPNHSCSTPTWATPSD